MYEGDMARKKSLVEYGFRLPSAKDNRPLTFAEFEKHLNQVIFMSATPGQFEWQQSAQIVEMIVRPTFLIDPEVICKPAQGQFDDLVHELRQVSEKGDRALVTTITKRDSEKLASYLGELGMRVKYLHSEIDTLERVEILQDLRLGEFDILVGVNLLREGLDLPEVTLVAILDADRAGFLRTETALIQTIGRTARNVRGRVILYADEQTPAIQATLTETSRRRQVQLEYNEKHGITPKSIEKEVRQIRLRRKIDDEDMIDQFSEVADDELTEQIESLEEQMRTAADNLEFERAAKLRDRIRELSDRLFNET
ncbi:MAG: helicase-related protein, partial [Promethearchaeota archaeon]